MDILTVKEVSLIWGISVRRINVLCNQGRILGAKKIAGVWLLPKDAKKPMDARVKSGEYRDWRNKSNMKSNNFEDNLKNLNGTFAVEGMTISTESAENLKKLSNGEISCLEIVEILKQKYIKGYE